jgi:Flp pilus assembly pilin Flp
VLNDGDLKMINFVQALRMYLIARTGNERGVTTVEYAIMLALVAIAVATLAPGVSGAVTGIFTDLVTALNAL